MNREPISNERVDCIPVLPDWRAVVGNPGSRRLAPVRFNSRRNVNMLVDEPLLFDDVSLVTEHRIWKVTANMNHDLHSSLSKVASTIPDSVGFQPFAYSRRSPYTAEANGCLRCLRAV